MPRGLRLPSPAMAVALLALVASTTGVGIAAVKIDGADLKDRSVSTPKLKIGVIRAPQLATGAVTTTKIKSRAVTVGKIAPGAVTTDALATGTIRADDLGTGSVGSAQIADGAVLAPEIGTGAVTDAKIANGTVSRAKLAADALLPVVAVRRSAGTTVPGNSIVEITATCGPGERLMGGGAAGTAIPALETLSVIGAVPSPNGDGEVPTAWVATIHNASATPADARAYAVCARAA